MWRCGKILISCWLACWTLFSVATQAPNVKWLADLPLRQQQAQQQALQQRFAAHPPIIHLQQPVSPQPINFPDEKTCFLLHKVILTGQSALPFWVPLQDVADLALGRCLGVKGINMLMSAIQQRLISHGWSTTQVVAPPQSIQQGELKLHILAGKIRNIRYSKNSDSYASLTSSIPLRSGQLFDLKALEQGLENLQRIPNVSASMQLLPTDAAGESDIVITRHQKRFWHMSSWLDNSGTKQTGRPQVGIMFALDNPTSFSDLFYVAVARDLAWSSSKKSINYTAHYSVPFGYQQFSVTANKYHYSQIVPEQAHEWLRRGKSENLDFQLSRVMYRSSTMQTSLHYGITLWKSTYLMPKSNATLAPQRTTQWNLGVKHRQQIKQATFEAEFSYQRGTDWFGATSVKQQHSYRKPNDKNKAAEIYKMSARLELPFQVAAQRLSYRADYVAQISRSSLIPQQQFSIGGRWSVRGFDGERQLSANQGWYLRNTLSWQLPVQVENQQLYIGVDYGHISGSASDVMPGRNLAGAVIGWNGELANSNLQYDVSVGTPLSKPKGFKSDKTQINFSISWHY